MSHFLLDLQEAHQKSVVGLGTGIPSNISQNVDSIRFNESALGSVGATVGLPIYMVQEEEGERTVVASEDHPVEPEGVRPDEGETIHDSESRGQLVVTEVHPVEDESECISTAVSGAR